MAFYRKDCGQRHRLRQSGPQRLIQGLRMDFELTIVSEVAVASGTRRREDLQIRIRYGGERQ